MYELSLIGIGASLICVLIAGLFKDTKEWLGIIYKYCFVAFALILIYNSFGTGVIMNRYDVNNVTTPLSVVGDSLAYNLGTIGWLIIIFFAFLLIYLLSSILKTNGRDI